MKGSGTSLGLILSLFAALLMSGCASGWSGNNPTLKQTDLNVSWPMTRYRNEVIAGRVTLGEREQVEAAYTKYKAAFDEALSAAHNNRDAPTPENVQAQANELMRMLSALPY
jgi:hypothetical protein